MPSSHVNILFFLVKFFYPFICHSFCPMLLLMSISTIFLRAKIIFQNQLLAVDSTAHYLCSYNLSYFPRAVLLFQPCSLTRVMGTVSHCGTQTPATSPFYSSPNCPRKKTWVPVPEKTSACDQLQMVRRAELQDHCRGHFFYSRCGGQVVSV